MNEIERQISSKFERLFIHKDSLDSEVTHRLKIFFKSDNIEVVSDRPFFDTNSRLSREEFDRSKKNLFLTKFKGEFFKRCPGSKPGLACCNYYVLNWGLQCDFNCSYCYLQSFINSPVTTLYTNIEDAVNELKTIATEGAGINLRIGTGEVVDSLSLDPLTLYSQTLIRFFRTVPNWQLEFKTKSSYVDQFLQEPHSKNVIVSWSINPQLIIENEEHLTASLMQRLASAKKCIKNGFKIAFHIDPVIWHPQWKASYSQLVETILEQFSPEDLSYLSIGALRYQKEQRHMIRERFGTKSLSLSGEMFPSSDGKLRYDFTLRTEMYNFILERFKNHSAKWKIFICMETPEAWLSAEAENPYRSEQLKDLFDPKVPSSVSKNLNQAMANPPTN